MATITILDLEFDVVVDSYTSYDPGRIHGPPEDCYPPEGGEIEWHVEDDHPIGEFIQAAIDNNSEWVESVEEQIFAEYANE